MKPSVEKGLASDSSINMLRQSNCNNEHQSIDTKDNSSNINQEHLIDNKKEIDMLHEININKESVNFYLK